MSKILPLIMMVILPLLCSSQEKRDTLYYTDARFWKYAKGKSDYMHILIEKDGINTEIQQNLKKERVYLKKSFKHNEPVGIWEKLTKTGIVYRDYDFNVAYTNQHCSRINEIDPATLLLFDIESIKYEKPTIVINGDEKKFRVAFRRFWNPPKSIRTKALKGGLTIKVDAQFEVTKNGTIKNIQIIKSQDPFLDKEVVRTLKQMKFTTPAIRDGKEIDICARFPVRIQIQPNAM